MKTLWIGCSHSAGYYNSNDLMLSERGLPFEVGKNYGLDNWKAISCPGQGIIEYNNILDHLDQNNLLNFDNLILQLTSEPRLVSFCSKGESLKFSYIEEYIKSSNDERKSFVYRNDDDYTHDTKFQLSFNRHPVSLYGIYRDTFPNNTEVRDALLSMCENLTYSLGKHIRPLIKAAFKNIIEITERRGIKLYTFSWVGISTYEFLGNVDYHKYDLLDGSNIIEESVGKRGKRSKLCTLPTYHPTKEGITFSTNLITQRLNDKGFNG